MFERFTDNARRVVVISQDEARSLEHDFIRPEHLLLGLIKGEGVAATALREVGIDYGSARETVAGAVAPNPAAAGLNKVPFSPKAKKVLELSLREALQLGHNYIGTEHILLGVLRQAGAEDAVVSEVIGTRRDRVKARVLELLSKTPPVTSLRSPALSDAMDRARQQAGGVPLTTGHLLLAVLADPESQASKALAALAVDEQAFAASLAQVDVADTSDAVPGPRAFEIKVGGVVTTVRDPDLAAALQGLTSEEIRAVLQRALGSGGGGAGGMTAP
jgi:ATP-dependent Clp protease ATP-binding subunit ClpA